MPHSQPTALQQTVCKFHLDPQYHISHWGSTILGDSTLCIVPADGLAPNGARILGTGTDDYKDRCVVLLFVCLLLGGSLFSLLKYIDPVFKISARPRTLTGKIWVGQANFPSLSYIHFGKIVLQFDKFQILF